MYVQKKAKRGYTEYLSLDDGAIGTKAMMDVGFLILEQGDTYEFFDDKKEIAYIVFKGHLKLTADVKEYEVLRNNPFDQSTACVHICAGSKSRITAIKRCEIYVQKTLNDKKFDAKYYSTEDTDTWHRGDRGELNGCIRRDVRTSFDYEINPRSNMVLGEVVNLPGKWSSYPPHWHPQPEVYFYYFEKPQGIGASWINGQVHEIGHLGLSIITEKSHPVVTGPGYACCYAWGIRHIDGNPWVKTRIDDKDHEWLLDPDAQYWGKEQ